MSNGLITQGMGSSSSLLTMGMGDTFDDIIEVIESAPEIISRLARRGRSSKQNVKDQVEEVVVFAKLLVVNHVEPKKNVSGTVRIKFDASKSIVVGVVNEVAFRSRRIWESVKITIKRLR